MLARVVPVAAVALTTNALALSWNAMRAIYDPADGDAVAAVGELSALDALENMKKGMMGDREGRRILINQPLITDEILKQAQEMPDGTFGSAYAAYMTYNHFTPNARTPVKYIHDSTLAYVMTRYRQSHDFMHTITGCGRTVEEELALKLLEWYHTGLPFGVMSIAGGARHLNMEQLARMRVYRQWAAANAPRSVHTEKVTPLYLNLPWEDMLDWPLDHVIDRAGITPLQTYLQQQKSAPET